jgi:hypothetical protein
VELTNIRFRSNPDWKKKKLVNQITYAGLGIREAPQLEMKVEL